MIWVIMMCYQELKTPVTAFFNEEDARLQAFAWNFDSKYHGTGTNYVVEKCMTSDQVTA